MFTLIITVHKFVVRLFSQIVSELRLIKFFSYLAKALSLRLRLTANLTDGLALPLLEKLFYY